MTVRDRDIAGLVFFNLPLSGWREREPDSVLYQIDEEELDLKTRVSGKEFVLERITQIGPDAVRLDYQARMNSWDNDLPPLHLYDRGSVVCTKDEINKALRLGCAPGRKTQIKWTP